MAELRTGCLSWTYPDCVGSFYPDGTKSADFLRLYSKVFDIVEVDSTFYRAPSSSMVKQWRERTPDSFLFSVKIPKKITHEARLKNIEKELDYFQRTIRILGPKLACVIAQLPPSIKYDSGFDSLKEFLNSVDSKIRFALEFRHESWLRNETYDLLKDNKTCFVWSVSEHVENLPPEMTTDFPYLRFMGEFREFTKFDRIQKDRTEVLKKWWKILEPALSSVPKAFVLVSNHFSGFAPAAVNQFRKIAGLDELDWKERWAHEEVSKQLF